MTIEQLLDLPPSGLESISDEDLEKMLAPYFKFTRPAQPIATSGVLRPSATKAKKEQSSMLETMMKKAISNGASIDEIMSLKTLFKNGN